MPYTHLTREQGGGSVKRFPCWGIEIWARRLRIWVVGWLGAWVGG